MKLVLANDGNSIWPGYLGGVSSVEDNPRVRVDEELTRRTFKECSTYKTFRIGECMFPVELLLEVPFAPPAPELAVECFLGFGSGSKFVRVAFDDLPR